MHNNEPPPPQNTPNILSVISNSAQFDSNLNSQSDELAKKEKDYLLNDGERGEAYRKHIHNIVITGMWVIGISMIALILVRMWHFAAPECWRWLNDKDTHNIERVVFSGIILSLATKYFKRYKLFEDEKG